MPWNDEEGELSANVTARIREAKSLQDLVRKPCRIAEPPFVPPRDVSGTVMKVLEDNPPLLLTEIMAHTGLTSKQVGNSICRLNDSGHNIKTKQVGRKKTYTIEKVL